MLRVFDSLWGPTVTLMSRTNDRETQTRVILVTFGWTFSFQCFYSKNKVRKYFLFFSSLRLKLRLRLSVVAQPHLAAVIQRSEEISKRIRERARN